MTSRFVIANHFRRHAILKFLSIELISELALAIPINFDLNLLQTFLQDRLPNMREVLHNVRKIYHLIFLQKPNDVRLGSRLDIVLVVAGLRVVNLLFWLYLANSEQIIQLANDKLLLTLFSFNQDAKKVCPLRCVEEDRRVVHFVFQDCQTFKDVRIYLTQQIKPLTWLLQDNLAIRSHVSRALIFMTLLEYLFTWLPVIVKIPFQTASHSKVIEEQGMLVNVLENAEFALGQGQLISIFEVVVWVKSLL